MHCIRASGFKFVGWVGVVLWAVGGGWAGYAHTVAEEMAEAASRFLAALTPAQREKAVFELSDANRQDWHFVPRPRKGVPLKELSEAQRHLGYGLLATALSQRGLLKAHTIISLEAVLKELEQGRGPVRDAELYYFSVFGKPADQGRWGWRFEGHHLSLNFTLVDGRAVTVTPTMFGSNPGEVRQGALQGLRVLGSEEDLGRSLASSLSEQQRDKAFLKGAVPGDVLLGPERKATRLSPAGISATELAEDQRRILKELVIEYVRRYRAEVADEELRRIAEAGGERLFFAWAGGLERGQPHYYRVQGQTFILEYDNTQNDANHIHTVWRDTERDFGDDPLRRHIETSHESSVGGRTAAAP